MELYANLIVHIVKIILVQVTKHFYTAAKQLANSRGQQFYSLFK